VNHVLNIADLDAKQSMNQVLNIAHLDAKRSMNHVLKLLTWTLSNQ
jgi:hypothetical protein